MKPINGYHSLMSYICISIMTGELRKKITDELEAYGYSHSDACRMYLTYLKRLNKKGNAMIEEEF